METNPYEDYDTEMLLDALYAQRAYALDKECTWNVRNSAWAEIDDLLDHFNTLLKAEVEVML